MMVLAGDGWINTQIYPPPKGAACSTKHTYIALNAEAGSSSAICLSSPCSGKPPNGREEGIQEPARK